LELIEKDYTVIMRALAPNVIYWWYSHITQ